MIDPVFSKQAVDQANKAFKAKAELRGDTNVKAETTKDQDRIAELEFEIFMLKGVIANVHEMAAHHIKVEIDTVLKNYINKLERRRMTEETEKGGCYGLK